jgi:uncharacterized OsmC-like protein
VPTSRANIKERQRGIRERYAAEPNSTPVRLRVHGGDSDLADPLHCEVVPESVQGVTWRSGAHGAVGGEGDAPCSADLLLGALAACQEITLRMVAANLGIGLQELEVQVEGDWDPRGTLAMGPEFPIGLTAIRCHTRIVLDQDEVGDRADRLLRSAERYCVVLNTLRQGVPVASTFQIEPAD